MFDEESFSDFCCILYAAVITLFTLWQHRFSITLVLKLELNFKADAAYCICSGNQDGYITSELQILRRCTLLDIIGYNYLIVYYE